MSVRSNIAVATSIPPNFSRRNAGAAIDGDYQKLCIRSWIDCGFRVLSVNPRDEIAALADRYPEVAFVEIDLDARAPSERKNPRIADLLSVLTEVPEPVLGIVNSDIIFEPSSAWCGHVPNLVKTAVVTGQRHDATSLLTGTFRKYYWGFDYFFFDHDLAQKLARYASDFAMGLAWWDYWLPASASLSGRDIVVLDRPTIAHLIHKEPYLDTGWRRMGLAFARFIDREARAHTIPESIRPLLPLCRELAEVSDDATPNHALDMRISQLALDYVPQLTRNARSLDGNKHSSQTGSDDDRLTPSNVFQRFPERFRAGETLERAKRLETEGKPNEAGTEFRTAWGMTPDDADVLAAYGEYLFHRRNFPAAIDLLEKAAEQQPDSCRLLNVLAAALRASGRYADAIARLEAALTSEPEDQPTYCNLALTLNDAGRRADAIHCLERALTKWPGFADASQLLARLRRR